MLKLAKLWAKTSNFLLTQGNLRVGYIPDVIACALQVVSADAKPSGGTAATIRRFTPLRGFAKTGIDG